jgi:hypothetical protein
VVILLIDGISKTQSVQVKGFGKDFEKRFSLGKVLIPLNIIL